MDTDADLVKDFTEAAAAAVTAAAGHEGHILVESVVKKTAAEDPVYHYFWLGTGTHASHKRWPACNHSMV